MGIEDKKKAVNLGFIIPTMNRPKELNRLLQSIYEQPVKPSTLVIVDSSQTPVESGLLKDDSVKIIYKHVLPPGLTKQRNIGISLLPSYLTHVGFLDDDLVLLEGSSAELLDFLENDKSDVGGVSFNIIDSNFTKKSLLAFLKRSLGQIGKQYGKITQGGSVLPNMNLKETIDTQWLCGGATVWKKSVFDTFKYDEWYQGYALWEDIDFSYRVSQKHRLVVLAKSKVNHLHIVNHSPTNFRYLGDVEVVDRFHFVMKHIKNFSYLAAIYAGLGTFILNLLMALKTRKLIFLTRAKSNFMALCRCAAGRIQRVG